MKYTPDTNTLANLGEVASGEVYSLLSYANKINMAAYVGGATLMSYDPTLPLNPIPYVNPNCGALDNAPNPQCVGGLPNDWRPGVLISAPNGLLYGSSVGSYGELNGPLFTWNVQNNTESTYYPFTNLGITTLVVANNCQGVTTTNYCIVGGTTVSGGDGINSTAKNAPLFILDPTSNTVVKQITIPSVLQVGTITKLIVNPANNDIYGTLLDSAGHSLYFIFNPSTGQFINGGTKLPFALSNNIYNSDLAFGSDGNIWGQTSTGIFTINVTNNTPQYVATAPEPITAGFDLVKDSINGDKVYFASNANLYVYNLPFTPSSSSSTTPTLTPEPGFNFPNTPTPITSATITNAALPLNNIPLLAEEETQNTIEPTPHVAKYITYLPSSGKAGTIPEETTTSLIYFNLQLTMDTFLQTMNHLFGNIGSHFFH